MMGVKINRDNVEEIKELYGIDVEAEMTRIFIEEEESQREIQYERDFKKSYTRSLRGLRLIPLKEAIAKLEEDIQKAVKYKMKSVAKLYMNFIIILITENIYKHHC